MHLKSNNPANNSKKNGELQFCYNYFTFLSFFCPNHSNALKSENFVHLDACRNAYGVFFPFDVMIF